MLAVAKVELMMLDTFGHGGGGERTPMRFGNTGKVDEQGHETDVVSHVSERNEVRSTLPLDRGHAFVGVELQKDAGPTPAGAILG